MDVSEFREKLATTRQELRVRRVSLSDLTPPAKYIKPADVSPARSIEGSEYKVRQVGETRMYSSKVGVSSRYTHFHNISNYICYVRATL